jgi:hypothetical protein
VDLIIARPATSGATWYAPGVLRSVKGAFKGSAQAIEGKKYLGSVCLLALPNVKSLI